MVDEPARLLFQRIPGEPSGFYLHRSIKNESQRESLRDKIITNGGKVQDEERGADTVLIDPKHLRCDIQVLQLAYSTQRDEQMRQIVVEPLTFVQRCLEYHQFTHYIKKREGMGGYIGRRPRNEFTPEDEDNLCWYISRRIPDPEDGGRLSYGIWKEALVAAEVDPSLKWVTRHTFQSWREHYRRKRARFDPIIAGYAMQAPPEPTALYGLSRRNNKNPYKALKFVQHKNDVIELTEESEPESEEGSSEELEVVVKPERHSQLRETFIKESKRRRVESSDESLSVSEVKRKKVARLPSSSPYRSRSQSLHVEKGKGKEIARPDQGHQGSFNFSPAPELFEPVLPQSQQSLHSARQVDMYSTPPAPSPTLVQRASSVVRSPPSRRRVNIVAPPSPRPSTSFRNVVHSSPIFAGTGSPNRNGVRSHNSSVTEPSSRSVVAPLELVRPSENAANAPAESSITRESSHKPSSPNSQPMPMKKASRKFPSRQPPTTLPSDEDEEGEHETQSAPYKNTRSRSRSVDPVTLPVQGRKKRGKNGKGREMSKNEQPLEPVHESEVEQGLDTGMIDRRANTSATETMQDEQNVADLLMPNPEEPASGTLSGASIEQIGESEDDSHSSGGTTEDEDERVKHTFRQKNDEKDEEAQRVYASEGAESAEDEETVKFQTAPTTAAESLEPQFEEEEDDDINDISSFSESEGEASPGEQDSALDISPDDEAIEQQFLSQSLPKQKGSRHRRGSSLSSDDEEVDQGIGSPSTSQNTPAKTAKEVLDLFDSSPEFGRSQEQQKQRPRFNDFRTGSPSPLRPQNQNRPRQSLPVSSPSQATSARKQANATPVNQAMRRLTGPHRVSFSGGRGVGDGGLPSSPSSTGSLPRTPFVAASQPIHGRSGSQAHSRRSIPSSQARQSHSRGHRRASAESTSSELQPTFPITGTRASAVKQRLEQELKESPYSPPSGTRAARIIVAERSSQPRRR